MSRNPKKFFWPLLVAVLSLSGGLIFAFGRAFVLYVESSVPSISTLTLGPTPSSGRGNQNDISGTDGFTGTSGTARQRDFNRYHELRDQLLSGQPATVAYCAPGPTSRGTVFVTADGTSATFVSDTTNKECRYKDGVG